MNYKLMLRMLGRILQLEALLLLLPTLVALLYRPGCGPRRTSSPGRALPWWA